MDTENEHANRIAREDERLAGIAPDKVKFAQWLESIPPLPVAQSSFGLHVGEQLAREISMMKSFVSTMDESKIHREEQKVLSF